MSYPGAKDLKAMSATDLLAETQYWVDSHRRTLDDCLAQVGMTSEHDNTVMTFTGRLHDMVEECQIRGLLINVDR